MRRDGFLPPVTIFGLLDEELATAVERGDGSHDVLWLDIRSLEATRRESGASPDAACHCRGKKEKRPHRRQQAPPERIRRAFCLFFFSS